MITKINWMVEICKVLLNYEVRITATPART